MSTTEQCHSSTLKHYSLYTHPYCGLISGLRFALDPTHVPPSIRLSNSTLMATYQAESPPTRRTSNHSVQPLPIVCGDVVIGRGQFYWEVDVCDSSVYRIGEIIHVFVSHQWVIAPTGDHLYSARWLKAWPSFTWQTYFRFRISKKAKLIHFF